MSVSCNLNDTDMKERYRDRQTFAVRYIHVRHDVDAHTYTLKSKSYMCSCLRYTNRKNNRIILRFSTYQPLL